MRVLVVEDASRLANKIAEGLRDHAIAVDVAYDGHEAAAKLNLTSCDVVVLDRDLPGIDGDTLCQTIVAAAEPAMILMLTAAGAAEDRVAGLSLGADDYLPKPFHFPELGSDASSESRKSSTPLQASATGSLRPRAGCNVAASTQRGWAGTRPPAALFGILHGMALYPTYPLCSPRLCLRPLGEPDVDSLVAYRSLPDVCRYVPFEPMDAAAVRERLHGPWGRSVLEAEGEALLLGVELISSGELIGDVMLRWTSATDRGGEIGYVLHPAYSGDGFATEAAHRLLHLAFDELGLHRVIARVDAENQASARLAARLGMRQEAHLIQNEWFKGRWSDELDFALLEAEWHAMNHDGCLVDPPN